MGLLSLLAARICRPADTLMCSEAKSSGSEVDCTVRQSFLILAQIAVQSTTLAPL